MQKENLAIKSEYLNCERNTGVIIYTSALVDMLSFWMKRIKKSTVSKVNYTTYQNDYTTVGSFKFLHMLKKKNLWLLTLVYRVCIDQVGIRRYVNS